jgi:hypothetical protein
MDAYLLELIGYVLLMSVTSVTFYILTVLRYNKFSLQMSVLFWYFSPVFTQVSLFHGTCSLICVKSKGLSYTVHKFRTLNNPFLYGLPD